MEEIYARFEALDGMFAWIELVTLAFIGLAVIEFAGDKLSGHPRRLLESVANALIAVGYEIAGYATTIITIFVGGYLLQPYAVFDFEMTPSLWVLAFILADFTYYWMHRFEHEVRFLWAYHVVHHSSPEFNLTTGFRLSWAEGFFEWVFFLPMILLGFDVATVLAVFVANLTYQTWIHTQAIGKLGILDKIINTPSAHRVHHGSNPKYLDKNYGGVFLVWDHLFGTYQAEEEAVVFGITKPVNSVNPFTLNFHEYIAIARDIAHARTIKEAWKRTFGHPGWTPDPADQTAKDQTADAATKG